MNGVLSKHYIEQMEMVLRNRDIKFKPASTECPKIIYFGGRMLTFGIVGSCAESTFDGKHIYFRRGSMDARHRTISIDYGDQIHHYHILDKDAIPATGELKATLVSVVNK